MSNARYEMEKRFYSIYLINTKLKKYERINRFYLSKKDLILNIKELYTEGAWLNNLYRNKYDGYFVLDIRDGFVISNNKELPFKLRNAVKKLK